MGIVDRGKLFLTYLIAYKKFVIIEFLTI